jgi:CDP-paratose 2-epimerase
MYSHILVTGGAGFVGCALALALKQAASGAKVTAFDNLRRRGSELNLRRLRKAEIAFIHGDVRSPGDLESLPDPPDLIVECSAEPSAQAGYGGSPEYLIQTNLLGCFHCLELARRHRADFLLLSSSRVYPYGTINTLAYVEEETRYSLCGNQSVPGACEHGISERFPLEGARSLYGMSKLAAELMVEEYADAYGLRTIINRCGLLTGPGQMAKSDQGVLGLWVAAHYFGRPLEYIGFEGSGKQVRDFLHVGDLADLILEQLRNWDTWRGRTLNIGGGRSNSLSLLECTDLCRLITGRSIPITANPQGRPADPRIYISDMRQAQALTAWRPRRNAEITLSEIFEWIRTEEGVLRGIL